MKKIAIITLSSEGGRLAGRLAPFFPKAKLFVHQNANAASGAERFHSILNLTHKIFGEYHGLIFIAPCGAVVRAIAPMLKHKTTDPAVVVLDAGGRYAISLLSGHEGGANSLALQAANSLGLEPVITTTTEALRNLIVGVGCRRGASSNVICSAIRKGLKKSGLPLARVRMLASAEIKRDEKGLHSAAQKLGIPLRLVPHDEILSTPKKFNHSEFVSKKINLPAVAEPSALLAGRRTQLILPKTIIQGVTVAIARENSMLWE